MMVSYQLGVESPVDCYIFQLQIFPFYVNIWSFVILAANKAMAVTSPFKHKRMMSRRVIGAVTSGVWLLAVIATAYFITNHADDVIAIAEFGVCVHEGGGFIDLLIFALLPALLSTILTIVLNVYLAMKAYQVQKQIEKEIALTGHTNQLKVLKKKQRSIRRNRKPIITLLVVISGQALIDMVFVPFHILGRYFINSEGYYEFVNYVVFYNMGYVLQFFTLLVYGFYFKQIHEPMVKYLRRSLEINNSVVPR